MNDAARPADLDRSDREVSTHYATFDWADYEPASSTVVETVARAAGVSTADLPEIHDCIEPCALDQLFGSQCGEARTTTGRVTFEYAGYDVSVHSCGQVVVRDPDAPHP